jgi:hypothetical protein
MIHRRRSTESRRAAHHYEFTPHARIRIYFCQATLLGDSLIASPLRLFRNYKSQRLVFRFQLHHLADGDIDCIELIPRSAAQFVQVDARILKTGHASSPKGGTIGEFLKHIVFAVHRRLLTTPWIFVAR